MTTFVNYETEEQYGKKSVQPPLPQLDTAYWSMQAREGK